MTLIRWEPVRELGSIHSEMNRLFNTIFDAPSGGGSRDVARRWIPAMDLVEGDGEYVLKADLPGVAEKDVHIELDDGVLTISGERKAEQTRDSRGYRRVERSWGSFSRSLTLPDGVDPDAVKAGFDRGVLEVRIPKPEASRPRKVEIAVGGGESPTVESAAEETPAV